MLFVSLKIVEEVGGEMKVRRMSKGGIQLRSLCKVKKASLSGRPPLQQESKQDFQERGVLKKLKRYGWMKRERVRLCIVGKGGGRGSLILIKVWEVSFPYGNRDIIP
jgi:hypothetical protein